ncbi:MAG: adenosylcobinamide-GDP ribazoletransferase [Sulfitobacter sp.]
MQNPDLPPNSGPPPVSGPSPVSGPPPKGNLITELWLAFVLLTRLPLPQLPQGSFERGAHAVWAYPLVGLLVGACGALTGQLALWMGLPVLAAATMSLCIMMLITGAMHEDGLADVCDGFWGGFTVERRLEIMRDSQIGTYGVLGLGLVTLLRISAISALLPLGGWAVVMAAVVSRAVMPLGMYGLPHARHDGLSHSVGKPPARAVALAAAFGVLAVMGTMGSSGLFGLVLAAGLTAGLLHLATRKIGGQTGDVLGSLQQLTETALLLACASLL